MGGPGASVLLPNKLSDTQRAMVEADLRKISNEVMKGQYYDRDFYVENTQPIEGNYLSNVGRNYILAIQAPKPVETEDEYLVVLKEFGFLPEQEMEFSAPTKQKEDHLILGELVLHFASMFNGIVNFGGALLPRFPEQMYKIPWFWDTVQWSDVESYFQQMVEPMPGKIVTIEYMTANNQMWVYHMADTTFMRAWLKHPYFHMIK